MDAFHRPPVGTRDLGVGGGEWHPQQRVVIVLIWIWTGAVRVAPPETGFGIGGQSLNPRRAAGLITRYWNWLLALAMATMPLYESRHRRAETGMDTRDLTRDGDTIALQS